MLTTEAKAVEASQEKKDKKPVDTLGTALALAKIMLYGDEGQVREQAWENGGK